MGPDQREREYGTRGIPLATPETGGGLRASPKQTSRAAASGPRRERTVPAERGRSVLWGLRMARPARARPPGAWHPVAGVVHTVICVFVSEAKVEGLRHEG